MWDGGMEFNYICTPWNSYWTSADADLAATAAEDQTDVFQTNPRDARGTRTAAAGAAIPAFTGPFMYSRVLRQRTKVSAAVFKHSIRSKFVCSLFAYSALGVGATTLFKALKLSTPPPLGCPAENTHVPVFLRSDVLIRGLAPKA